MGDYTPEKASEKWVAEMQSLLASTRELWKVQRPKQWLLFRSLQPLREKDAPRDRLALQHAKESLLYRGYVVWGCITRAYFPAYIPGKHTHYGSVVYTLVERDPSPVFQLAQAVNRLREDRSPAPAGTEKVAAAIRDDHSTFVRLKLPAEIGADPRSYLGNICIHRTRLPSGYLHDRLLPILVIPEETDWCCILPLRGWPPRLREIWLSGPPAYQPDAFDRMLKDHKIRP